ncbi:MAG: energy-coupling factor ABC transporter ATP-binding protein [Desulfobacteraceae bacterium]|nr:energy-coupling factor ABC transporter ATP-binding protein [Desulfobacteraceae bacterium]
MIDVRDLEYRYPDGTAALRGVSMHVREGEFLLICGPNGSGKTTLIRHINGLLKPFAGSVSVDGLDVVRFPEEVLQRVGMVFQDADSQIVGETVREDVAFGPENLGLSPAEVEQRVESALEMTGIAHLAEKSCHLLSGGEKRRVAVAGVLAMQPRVVVFDEPFANLDYPGVRQVLREILKLHEKGRTILVTTHDIEKVVAHVDRIAVIHKGELKAMGAPREIVPVLASFDVRPPRCAVAEEGFSSWLED